MFEYPEDPKEQIELCLNCPLPECLDCIRWGKAPEKMGKRNNRYTIGKLSVSTLIRLYNEGKSVYEMAGPLNISDGALQKRLKGYGLPTAKAGRPVLTREYMLELSPTIKARLNWED